VSRTNPLSHEANATASEIFVKLPVVNRAKFHLGDATLGPRVPQMSCVLCRADWVFRGNKIWRCT
jgi:hypothetical protein